MCNHNYNGCGCNSYNGGNYSTNSDFNGRCGCGCDNDFFGCGFGDVAFAQAARMNQRILARRACEDRAAIQYLRNMCCCRRCW